MGQFKDYEDLDEHPFTGLRKLSMPFKARIRNTEYIRKFFNGTPYMYEAVKLRYPEYTRQLDDVVIDDARN